MLKILSIITMVGCSHTYQGSNDDHDMKTGDIIFQVSNSSQSTAVALATSSPITHVGLIVVKDKEVSVIEAVEPVREVQLDKFIEHGSLWSVSRLKNEPEDPKWASKVVKTARKMKGKHYDKLFQWGDDKIYCSELVWKAYKSVGIELVEPQRLGDLNLSYEPVQMLIKKRTHGKEVNLDELVVSPGHLHSSKKLKTVMGLL